MIQAVFRRSHPLWGRHFSGISPNQLPPLTDLISQEVQQRTQELTDTVLTPINKTYLGPLPRDANQEHSVARPPMPLVFLLGNHSSGKSTFVNYLHGRKIQTTGVAPTDDAFTIIAPGRKDSDQDGPAKQEMDKQKQERKKQQLADEQARLRLANQLKADRTEAEAVRFKVAKRAEAAKVAKQDEDRQALLAKREATRKIELEESMRLKKAAADEAERLRTQKKTDHAAKVARQQEADKLKIERKKQQLAEEQERLKVANDLKKKKVEDDAKKKALAKQQKKADMAKAEKKRLAEKKAREKTIQGITVSFAVPRWYREFHLSRNF
jgi:hypothetical protein